MFDVQKLLGQFLGAGGTEPGPAAAGDGAPEPASIQASLDALLRNPAASALAGGLAGGLASRLFGGRNLGSAGTAALQTGGVALIASFAYTAYQNYQNAPDGPPLPADGADAAGEDNQAPAQPSEAAAPAPFAVPAGQFSVHSPDTTDDAWACLLLSAMIAAAKADGYIDASEEKEILGRLESLDLDPEERHFVRREMQKPQTIDELVAGATTPEAALQIYTASVLAIDADHPAEQAYLARLAIRLGLPSALTAEVRRAAAAQG
jgi:uncharacterized membrane protein YebE (DUF533 family)